MSMTDTSAKFGPYRATSCEWPIGIEKGNQQFCGCPVASPSAYCKKHLSMAYMPDSSRKKRKKKVTQ